MDQKPTDYSNSDGNPQGVRNALVKYLQEAASSVGRVEQRVEPVRHEKVQRQRGDKRPTPPPSDARSPLDDFLQLVRTLGDRFLTDEAYDGANLLSQFFDVIQHGWNLLRKQRGFALGDWAMQSIARVCTLSTIVDARLFQETCMAPTMDLMALFSSPLALNTTVMRKILKMLLQLVNSHATCLNASIYRLVTGEFIGLKLQRDAEVCAILAQFYQTIMSAASLWLVHDSSLGIFPLVEGIIDELRDLSDYFCRESIREATVLSEQRPVKRDIEKEDWKREYEVSERQFDADFGRKLRDAQPGSIQLLQPPRHLAGNVTVVDNASPAGQDLLNADEFDRPAQSHRPTPKTRNGLVLAGATLSPKDALRLICLDLLGLGFMRANNDESRECVEKTFHFLLKQMEACVEIFPSQPVLQVSLLGALYGLAAQRSVFLLADAQLVEIVIASLQSPSPRVKIHTIAWIAAQVAKNCHSDVSWRVHRAPIPSHVFTTLLSLTCDGDDGVRMTVATHLQNLAALRCFDEQQITDIVVLALQRLADTRKPVARAYTTLLQSLSSAVLLGDQFLLYDRQSKITPSNYYYLSKPLGAGWKERLLSRANPSPIQDAKLFPKGHFNRIMAFLGSFGADEDESGEWLGHIVFSSSESVTSNKTSDVTVGDAFDGFLSSYSLTSRTVGTFWALLECARYCVSAKLRTPFGAPNQTLEALQKMVAKVATLKDQSVVSDASQTNKKALSRIYEKHHHQLGVRLLLQFIDQFEKHIFNACEGSVNLPPVAHASTMQFFRANRRVCTDWLAHRMRQPLLAAALVANSPADVIRQAGDRRDYLLKLLQSAKEKEQSKPVQPVRAEPKERQVNILTPERDREREKERERERGLLARQLTDPERASIELESAVRHMATSLAQMHDCDQLVALQAWYNSHVKHPLPYAQRFSWLQSMHAGSWLQALLLHSRFRYEEAAVQYRQLLVKFLQLYRSERAAFITNTGEVASAPPQFEYALELIQFLSSQLIECFVALSDWKSAQEWLEEYEPIAPEGFGQPLPRVVAIDYMRALMSFDAVNYIDTSTWLNEVKKARGESDVYVDWADPQARLQRSLESLLMALAEYGAPSRLPTNERAKRAMSRVDSALSIVQDSLHVLGTMATLRESFPFLVQVQRLGAVERFLASKGGVDRERDEKGPNKSHAKPQQKNGTSASQSNEALDDLLTPLESRSLNPNFHDIGLWNNTMRVKRYLLRHAASTQMAQQNNDAAEKAREKARAISEQHTLVKLVKLARKQGNLEYASRHLSEALALKVDGTDVDGQRRSPGVIVAEIERAHLLFATKAHEKRIAAFQHLWTLYQSFERIEKSQLQYRECQLIAKMLLRVTRWINLNPGIMSREEFTKVFGSTMTQDELISRCFDEATSLTPVAAPPWYAFAEWCYGLGVRRVEALSSLTNLSAAPSLSANTSPVSSATNTAATLTLQDELQLWACILADSEVEVMSVALQSCGCYQSSVLRALRVRVFCKLTEVIVMALDAPNTSATATDTRHYQRELETTALVEQILREQNPAISDAAPIRQIVSIFLACRTRILSAFMQATRNYFQYLALGHTTEQTVQSGQMKEHVQAKEAMHGTKAALRIVKMMVQYGQDLSVALSDLESTPTLAWCSLVPQLRSHLGHPSAWVREQVSMLLNRIGKDYPSVLVYPTVVGCENKIMSEFQRTITQPQYRLLLGYFRSHSPTLVTEVQAMIDELTRIATTWEERALIVLRQTQNDVLNSRLRTIRDEINRIPLHTSQGKREALVQEIYANIMRPVIVKLTRLLNGTVHSRTTTPYERQFIADYGEALQLALNGLVAPSDYSDLERVFDPFKDIIKKIHRDLKRPFLKLSRVSPRLRALRSSCIPLPGLSLATGQRQNSAITIQSFEPIVAVISSKTKPKKILLRGSNGQKYSYLLKGRDDLNLDERIMQFLSIVNQILNRDSQCACRSMRARHYAVIPFSDTAGLIQWVEHATPLFSVYKQWRQSLLFDAANAGATNAGGATQGSTATPSLSVPVSNAASPTKAKQNKIPSPIELFESRMTAALKAKGIEYKSRKDWPWDVVKRVWLELQQETPSELLARELWASSTSLSHWWQITQAYGRSLAVMSMVGYLIGLGDRHLDNILIDFNTGEVVHIDYAICFEKALKLMVPELVPFRFTQNMVSALGPNGAGGFGVASGHVMRVLRGQREMLVTLLEAFVYDPIVDWTGSAKAQHEEYAVDLSVALRLFCSRLDETKAKYDRNIASLTEAVPGASTFDDIAKYLSDRHRLEAARDAARREIGALVQTTNSTTVAIHSNSQTLSNLHKSILPLLDKHAPPLIPEKEKDTAVVNTQPATQPQQPSSSPSKPGKHSKARQKKQALTPNATPLAILTHPPFLEQSQAALQHCQARVHVLNELMATCLQRDCIESLRVSENDGILLADAERNSEEEIDLLNSLETSAIENLRQWNQLKNTCVDILQKYNRVLLQLPLDSYMASNLVCTWHKQWAHVTEALKTVQERQSAVKASPYFALASSDGVKDALKDASKDSAQHVPPLNLDSEIQVVTGAVTAFSPASVSQIAASASERNAQLQRAMDESRHETDRAAALCAAATDRGIKEDRSIEKKYADLMTALTSRRDPTVNGFSYFFVKNLKAIWNTKISDAPSKLNRVHDVSGLYRLLGHVCRSLERDEFAQEVSESPLSLLQSVLDQLAVIEEKIRTSIVPSLCQLSAEDRSCDLFVTLVKIGSEITQHKTSKAAALSNAAKGAPNERQMSHTEMEEQERIAGWQSLYVNMLSGTDSGINASTNSSSTTVNHSAISCSDDARGLVRECDALFLNLEADCARLSTAVAASRSDRERVFLEVFFCQKTILVATAVGFAVNQLSPYEANQKVNTLFDPFVFPLVQSCLYPYTEAATLAFVKRFDMEIVISDAFKIYDIFGEYLTHCKNKRMARAQLSSSTHSLALSHGKLKSDQNAFVLFRWLNDPLLIYEAAKKSQTQVVPSTTHSTLKTLELQKAKEKEQASMDQRMLSMRSDYLTRNDFLAELKRKSTSVSEAADLVQRLEQQGVQGVAGWEGPEKSDHVLRVRRMLDHVGQGARLLGHLLDSLLDFEGMRTIFADPNDYTDKSDKACQFHFNYYNKLVEIHNNCLEVLPLTYQWNSVNESLTSNLTTYHNSSTRIRVLESELAEMTSSLDQLKSQREKSFLQCIRSKILFTYQEQLSNARPQHALPSLVVEIDTLLHSIISITENWDTMAHTHGLAKKIQKSQQMYRREYDLFIKHCNLVLCIAEAHTAALKVAHDRERSERGERERGKQAPPIKILASPNASVSQTVEIVMSIDEEKAQRLYGDLHRLPADYFATQGARLLKQQKRILRLLLTLSQATQSDKESTQRADSGSDSGSEEGTETRDDAETVSTTMAESTSPTAAGPERNASRLPVTRSDSSSCSSEEADESLGLHSLRTNKPTSQMQQNAMALTIVRRVREKLDGIDGVEKDSKDKESRETRTVAEQVSWLMAEASAVNNLARMYEGWTSWI